MTFPDRFFACLDRFGLKACLLVCGLPQPSVGLRFEGLRRTLALFGCYLQSCL